MTLRKKVAIIMDDSNTKNSLSRLVNIIVITTILVTVLSIILESERSLHPHFTPFFYITEFVSLIIFSLEYFSRIWSAPDSPLYAHLPPYKARLKYLTSFMAIVDFLAIAPFLLSFFSVDLRFLRIVRLIRILKLTRYNSAMISLMEVIKKEGRTFFSVLLVLVIILIIASSGMYLIEHRVQPDSFGSIPQAMWWTIVTLATVGFGDVVPITPLGKFFGGMTMLVGIGVVALPAGILASAFSAHLHKSKKSYRSAVQRAIKDGIISPQEYAELKMLQEKYDLTSEDAEEIIQTQFHSLNKKDTCPHCGEFLNK